MHSIHLEFNTLQELQSFMSARSNTVTAPTAALTAASVTAPTAEFYQQDPFSIVMELLEDERFTLRSIKTLCEKSGLNRTQLFDLFNKENIDVVTRTKRGSGDELVGLANRN